MNWVGVVSHPEPDTLECEVKWAFFRSTAVNKASGCDEIPAELFKFLKEEAIEVLHSLCLHIWKTEQWPQDWKRLILIPIPKKGSTKECTNHQTVILISHSSKVILKILHARLQHYVNQELPDIQAEFRKGRGTRDQIVNICWIIEKAREFQENIHLCFIDYIKAFDCVDHDKQWKALTEMGTPDRLEKPVCGLRSNSYNHVWNNWLVQDWERSAVGLSAVTLFNLYTEHIMRNAGAGWVSAGTKRSRRNINNLRYVDWA